MMSLEFLYHFKFCPNCFIGTFFDIKKKETKKCPYCKGSGYFGLDSKNNVRSKK